ncbi:MAG: DUF499 domain-containing protein, partial [Holosporales bacterium]|nr:DUF499 domain-containing protein [Holosporales bacterium]
YTGKASSEYRDPIEFFGRTYITKGLSDLLTQAFLRVSGKGGEPVIQLKTAFGGGKTHSMLALYHSLRSKTSPHKLPGVDIILKENNMTDIPKAHIAVIVGTAINPTTPRKPNNFPKHSINTIWGEIAYQLAMSTGKQHIYEFIKEADKKGVSPGSQSLKDLFDTCGPCLILMDELVAYGKRIYNVERLPAGTFDNFTTFIQELTEAAKATKNCLIVASLPESTYEIGGESGQETLKSLEHYFGRIQSIWKPVSSDEGFEIVRRRLFLDCKNPEWKEQVCSAYSKLYYENSSEFPSDTAELEYKKRIQSCYPIHPEIFDRLYGDWASLDTFQRTRGVLRLMAAVIHKLWSSNDSNYMIMPGSIPIYDDKVKSELLRYIPPEWNSIIDTEIDGQNSIPTKKDSAIQRFNQIEACRRVSRTLVLGSAPSSRGQNIRGIEKSRIRLGVMQPYQNISDYNSALDELQDSLTFLYTNDSRSRFWFDTRPTLKKTVHDRVTQYDDSKAFHEIENRLKKLHRIAPFSGVHPCPINTSDIPDEQVLRLVILPPTQTYETNINKSNNVSITSNKAMETSLKYATAKGNTTRTYQNMLLFIAPDYNSLANLVDSTKYYLAWKTILEDSETLNLDEIQKKEAIREINTNESTMLHRLVECYRWLLIPETDKEHPDKAIEFEQIRLTADSEDINSIIENAKNRLIQDQKIICSYSPLFLKKVLDTLLWQENDSISIEKIWNTFTSYCYMPKLSNFTVLENTIREGLRSQDYFAMATGFENNKYIDLKYNQPDSQIYKQNLLVKIDVAKKQLISIKIPEGTTTPISLDGGDTFQQSSGLTQPIPPTHTQTSHKEELKNFFMSVDLNPERINRDVNDINQEILNHFRGNTIKITLDVSIESSTSFIDDTIRTVKENCTSLNIKKFEFNK